MPTMTIKTIRVTTLLFACLVISACGGKKTITSEGPITDITRPPTTVKGVEEQNQEETNPDETVSYDEWRRRRQKEAERDAPP